MASFTPEIQRPYHETYVSNQSLQHLSDEEEIYYFAYGSNMDSSQMEKRRQEIPETLARNGQWPDKWSQEVKPAIPIGAATLTGYRLIFNKTSKLNPKAQYASVVPDRESQTEGVLWKLDKKFIEVLDYCEGVANNHYTRELVRVKNKTGQVFRALIYIAHPEAILPKGEPGRPSREYQQKLLRGATEFKLSEKHINLIKNWPTAEEP